jgi:phospholipid transport system substrate-binding protein
MNKSIAIFTFLLTLIFASNVRANDSNEAKDFISKFGNKVIEVASNKDVSVDVRRDRLISLIESVIDSKWIAKFVLARNYRTASQDQKDRFQSLYRDFMIHTYAPSFNGYNGEKFKVKDVIQQGKYFMVKCLFIPKEGPKVNISFRLKKNNKSGNFVMLDVIAEGVSLIETQRSEFNSVISSKGMDSFLKDLDYRVKRLKKNK